ncbi:hypothetical protein [Pseudoduganella sp. OTU4001]|uniref:hypothetical protein n=1 Tax=Pseudoduganella sp. OTU4001 TaxID=3043854 RepID=UPI00313AA233
MSVTCYNSTEMNIRRFLVILLLLLLPVQVTLAAADSCCLAAQAASHVSTAYDAGDDADPAGACCTSCDFCHHSHVPFLAAVDEPAPLTASVAPVPAPEPPIHSFIADLPPRPNWLQ